LRCLRKARLSDKSGFQPLLSFYRIWLDRLIGTGRRFFSRKLEPDNSQAELPPKEIMGYHFSPNKPVYVGSVVLRNVPGALAGVAVALGRERVNLIQTASANIEGTETSVWGFFAEAEDSKVDMPRIKSLIEGAPNVVKAELVEGTDGVVIDKFHYPLIFNVGEKAMILRRRDLVDMFTRIKKLFGTGANVIIYEMGVAAGESDAKQLKSVLGEDRLIRNILEMVFLYSAQGWGVPEVVDLKLDPLEATIRIHDNFECSYHRSASPNSHYVRGHIVGLGAEIFGKRVACEEQKCTAKGDPYCEFVATQDS
jgi:predicted hydrocarbon binding protein